MPKANLHLQDTGWLAGWLEFNVPFQQKCGYLRDDIGLRLTQLLFPADSAFSTQFLFMIALSMRWQVCRDWWHCSWKHFVTAFRIYFRSASYIMLPKVN